MLPAPPEKVQKRPSEQVGRAGWASRLDWASRWSRFAAINTQQVSFGPFKANFGILEAHGDTSEEESEHDRFYSNKHSASELMLGLLEQISEFLNRMEPRQKRKASRFGEQVGRAGRGPRKGPEEAPRPGKGWEEVQKPRKSPEEAPRPRKGWEEAQKPLFSPGIPGRGVLAFWSKSKKKNFFRSGILPLVKHEKKDSRPEPFRTPNPIQFL